MTASTSDASFPTMEIEQVDVKTELPEDYLLSEDTTDPTSEELSNQKPFKCGICGHRTTADTLLKVHMKMHFAKRMHECHVCKQTFNFVTELNTHILSHSRDVSGLRCSHCGKDCFTSEDLQRHHQRFHTNEKPFKCKLCQRSFAEEFYLRAHERSHHGEGYAKKNMMEEGTFVDPSVVKHLGEGDAVKAFECDLCQKCFSNEEFLKIHYEAHMNESLQHEVLGPESATLLTEISDSYMEQCRISVPMTAEEPPSYRCDFLYANGVKCVRNFAQKTAFKVHMTSHKKSEDTRVLCHICKKWTKDDVKLLRHMKIKHSAQVHPMETATADSETPLSDEPKKTSKTGFQCTICSRIFPVPAKLRTHIRTHTGEKPFKCDICQKAFGTAGSLKEHGYLHLQSHERPFQCTVCGKGFVKNNSLENHARTHTGEKPYSCNICSKSYSSPIILNQHLLAHAKEKPFKCDVCDKSFIYLCSLKYHMVMHTDSKPFECETCGKKFSLRNSMKMHQKEHTGDKPHKCKFCTKSFTTVGSLKKHERIHTGEKPYVCKTCGRGFTQSSSLSRHVESHNGEKPYVCGVCNKGLTSASYLKIHLRIHNGEPPYRCKRCDATFSSNSKYRAHVNSHKASDRGSEVKEEVVEMDVKDEEEEEEDT